MRLLRQIILSGAAFVMLASSAVHADDPKTPTLKDLRKKPFEIRKSEPARADQERARNTYEQFLNLKAGDPELRAEATRRLGDLKLEAGEYERIEKDLAEGSPLNTRDAIRLYSGLMATFPDYPKRDGVLYQLARAYEADQQREKALETMATLVREYPRSRYVEEANFRSGEIYFSDKKWRDAQASYAAVVKAGPKSEFYEQSLYKHGWSLFKQGDGEAANDSFGLLLDRLLLEHGRTGEMVDLKRLTRPQRELLDDTLRAVVLTESYADGPKSVDALVQRHGARPYDWLLYSSLGDLYVSQQRYTDAADSYRAFVQRDPNHDEAPILAEAAIEAYRKGGFAALVLDGKREFVERYKLQGAFWSTRAPAASPEVVAHLKVHIQDLASYYHEQAQASKKPGDYQEAAHWYREFLQSFPEDASAPGTNYLLADTLFDSRQYHDAGLEYERTAYSYLPHEKSAAAGYAALVAYEKEESSLTAEARNAVHTQALDSALRFAVAFPTHPESVPVLVRCAREFYDVKNYDKALEAARLIVGREPPALPTQQSTAWTVIANSRFEQGDFVAAEDGYRHVQAVLPLNDPTRAAIDERLAAAVYKQAEQRQASGDSAGAVDDFLRVSALAPNAKIRANAEFDAAALLITMHDWPRAIDVLEGFRRSFPQSELQAQVTAKLAVAYSETGRAGKAAAEYERMAAVPGQTPEAQREALAQAGTLYEKAGDGNKAVSAWTAYVQRFPEPMGPALEARLRLAELAAGAGDAAARKRQLEAIVIADRGAGSARTDRTRYLAATASLELAAPARDAFDAIRLVEPLKKTLEAKKNAMQLALKAYSQANDYAVAEVSTAATFETAEIYRRLGQDLIKSERPASLKTAEEREQYDTLMEEQAYPFEEKAIAIHEVNLARAAEGTVDDSVRRSMAALAKLNPGKYGKAEVGEDYDLRADDPDLRSRLATAVELARGRKFSDAEVALMALAADAPTVSVTLLDLGVLYARQARWADAEKALVEAARLEPDNSAVHAELGIVYRALGRLNEAASAYRAALELDPGNPRVHRNLAILLDAYEMQPGAAVEHYAQALALGGSEDKVLAGWLADAKSRAAAPARDSK
jgi:cellulose synthase operon protein C